MSCLAPDGGQSCRTTSSAPAVLSLGLLAAWLVACSGERVLGDYPLSSCDLAEPPARVDKTPLAIASFWEADDKEREAFLTLLRRVDDERFLVWPQKMLTRVEVQRQMKEAFEQQKLPDVFQVNGGSDVLRWVERREPESTDVCALDGLRDRYGYENAYFEQALAPLSCRGSLYGLPVGIHHLNVLFYNRALMSQLIQLADARGVELVAPEGLHSSYELISTLKRVAELGVKGPSGKALVPLALGTTSEWPLTIVAFENVLLSLGRTLYERLWLGGLAHADASHAAELRAALAEMLAVLRSLVSFSQVDPGVSWQDAMRQVASGEALMTVTGDWGWAQLDTETLDRVQITTFPGTAGSFVYTPDSFAVPRELRKDGFPAHAFLHEVVESKQALIEFSNHKFSIPPRRDLSQEEVQSLATSSLRDSYRAFAECEDSSEDCKLLLAVSGLGPPPGADPCFDDMDALLTFAILNVEPPASVLRRRSCDQPFPSSRAKAEERLIDLLLGIARRPFADDCR